MKTKQQRAKKYLSAVKYFSKKKNCGGNSGFCDLLSYEESINLEDYYPEFWLFRPEHPGAYWFACEKYDTSSEYKHLNTPDQEDRVTALLFCYEMCK